MYFKGDISGGKWNKKEGQNIYEYILNIRQIFEHIQI